MPTTARAFRSSRSRRAWLARLATPLVLLAGLACESSPNGPSARRAPLSAPAQRLFDDVAWLADDAREGRRAGTTGEREAAQWLAGRMASIGLRPAGEDGFLQAFEVPLPPRDGGGSFLSWAGGGIYASEAGEGPELAPLFCAEAGTVEGELVYCGYGIADPDLGRDDFGGVDGTHKIALIVRGVPPYPPAETSGPGAIGFPPELEEIPDNWEGAGSLFLKAMNAKRRGFAAVVIANHPAAEPGSEGALVPSFDASRAARAGIPVLILSAAGAEKAVPGSYAARVRELDAAHLAVAPEVFAGKRFAVRADVERSNGTATNVLGLLRGRDPSRAIVIGAHFDHLGRGGPGSLAPSAQGEIHNGADDNASGTACVLEIAARLMTAFGAEGPPVDFLFALWSGEELGLLGSEHWTKHPTIPLAHVRANVNLDMVGRAGEGYLAVLGAGSSPVFASWMEPAGAAAGLDLDVALSGQGMGGSDHQVFLRRGIPALHLFSGVHADYHKPSDDVERFEAEGAARVVDLTVDLAMRMAREEYLVFVEPPAPAATPGAEAEAPRQREWKVWFGSVPNYVPDPRGLPIDGTSAGSPAEKAGLLAGDVITEIGDVKITSIHDLMYVLQVYKPGDVVLTRFLRDGAEQEVRVTLATREAE